jgi:hypothetical protein
VSTFEDSSGEDWWTTGGAVEAQVVPAGKGFQVELWDGLELIGRYYYKAYETLVAMFAANGFTKVEEGA